MARSIVYLLRATTSEKSENEQVIAGTSHRYAVALRRLDLDQSTFRRPSVMGLRRGWEQLKAVSVRCKDLPNAPNQMAVGSELSAGKVPLEFRHNCVEALHQFRNMTRGMTHLALP